MSAKQKAYAYCMQQLEQLQLGFVFDQNEFDRCFKGCSQLNPFSVGLDIADRLIFSHHQKIKQNESRN